jgi:hypothetical protein
MEKVQAGPRTVSPEQMLEEHRETWHSFMRYATVGAVLIAILLLAMRLFLV